MRRTHPALRQKITREAFAALGHIVLTPELRSLIQIEQSFAAPRSPPPRVYMTWHVRNADDGGHKSLRESPLAAFRVATAWPARKTA